MNLQSKFEEEYGNDYTLRKCKENDCQLKDISQDYFIIDGDAIKKSDEKSVDCIIIDLNETKEEKHVILCELTSGNKNLKDAKEKFISSGKLIIDYLTKINEPIYKIDCLLLGTIIKNGKPIDRKELLRKFKIQGHDENLIIQNEKCGFSITQLKIQ